MSRSPADRVRPGPRRCVRRGVAKAGRRRTGWRSSPSAPVRMEGGCMPVVQSSRMPRASVCGSAKISSIVLIGEAGTAAASSFGKRSAFVHEASAATSVSRRRTRWATRAGLVAKSGSSERWSSPHHLAKALELTVVAAARMKWPSASAAPVRVRLFYARLPIWTAIGPRRDSSGSGCRGPKSACRRAPCRYAGTRPWPRHWRNAAWIAMTE